MFLYITHMIYWYIHLCLHIVMRLYTLKYVHAIRLPIHTSSDVYTHLIVRACHTAHIGQWTIRSILSAESTTITRRLRPLINTRCFQYSTFPTPDNYSMFPLLGVSDPWQLLDVSVTRRFRPVTITRRFHFSAFPTPDKLPCSTFPLLDVSASPYRLSNRLWKFWFCVSRGSRENWRTDGQTDGRSDGRTKW